MDAAALIRRLSILPRVLPTLVAGVTDAEARWKPPTGAWSILEVVRHLGDEEADDFRARLRAVLDGTAVGPIDPEGWARQRAYNEGPVGEAVARFVAEREASLVWLAGIAGADWTRSALTPGGHTLRAGDLLASWAAHDALHLRQIAKRLWELAARDASGFGTGYAGEWRA